MSRHRFLLRASAPAKQPLRIPRDLAPVLRCHMADQSLPLPDVDCAAIGKAGGMLKRQPGAVKVVIHAGTGYTIGAANGVESICGHRRSPATRAGVRTPSWGMSQRSLN